MNIEQLKCIAEIVKQRTFLDAAIELNMSQSSVSKNIQKLEHEIGIPIFERTTRSVYLTEFGEEIYEHVENILREYNAILASASEHMRAERQYLRIGSIYWGFHNIVEPIIAEFAKNNPQIEVSIEESSTTPLIEKLKRRELDVIFVSSMYLQNSEKNNFSQENQFQSFTISLEPYYVVMNRAHPMSECKILTYQDIKGETFITTDKTMDVYHTALEKVFDTLDCTMKVAMHCTSVRSVLQMVSQGLGIAILSRGVIEKSDDLVMIPLENPLVRDNQIVILRKTKFETKKFWDYVMKKIGCKSEK